MLTGAPASRRSENPSPLPPTSTHRLSLPTAIAAFGWPPQPPSTPPQAGSSGAGGAADVRDRHHPRGGASPAGGLVNVHVVSDGLTAIHLGRDRRGRVSGGRDAAEDGTERGAGGGGRARGAGGGAALGGRRGGGALEALAQMRYSLEPMVVGTPALLRPAWAGFRWQRGLWTRTPARPF